MRSPPLDPKEASAILHDMADRVREGSLVITTVGYGQNEAETAWETTLVLEHVKKKETPNEM